MWKSTIFYIRDISMGIGINAGEVITGNLGSEDRINYCATGDTVNTGKRIETLTKSQENAIYISKAVYAKVKKVVNVEELPLQVVKGITGTLPFGTFIIDGNLLCQLSVAVANLVCEIELIGN